MKLLTLIALTLIGCQANAALVCKVSLNRSFNASLEEEIFAMGKSTASANAYETNVADYRISVRELGGGGGLYLIVKSSTGYLLQTIMPSPNETGVGKSETLLRVSEGNLVTKCTDK